MNRTRISRIASSMQSELAKIMHLEVTQADLKWVTITGLKVSSDLSYADVYVVARDESQEAIVLKALENHAKFLRHRLAQEINLRKTPELRFHYDHSLALGAHMDSLLSKMEQELKQREILDNAQQNA